MSAAASFARPPPISNRPVLSIHRTIGYHTWTAWALAMLDALAPVHRLSRDTLTRIFCLCLPKPSSGRQSEVEFVRPLPHTTPLVLTHVCKVWREIAITIPAL